MLDEPSMGLAPIIVEQIFEIITKLNQEDITILLVEQNAYPSVKYCAPRVCNSKWGNRIEWNGC